MNAIVLLELAPVDSVRGEVRIEVRLLPEGPRADLADERLLAGVDAAVLLQVPLLQKSP